MIDPRADAKAVFLRALECTDADERSRLLDRECGGDVALRSRVDELLRAYRDAGAFLGGAEMLTATADQAVRERPGTVIGPYELLEPIGEGGFGTVFLAQQTEPVRRKVALKVLKPGMDSRQVVARFEAERQALALMDHPNIARILDGGATAEGRPYVAMELVHGVPITTYCDDHQLTPRRRLGLFVPVCQAVQHAHQKGVIHRDLKPSNVLVGECDGRPVPKVIDFGVAKAAGQPLTDKTLVTGTGAVIGTPEYMSPEQAGLNQLDVDTRSDVYSLGVLLYELLTGGPPFTRAEPEQAGLLQMLWAIREREPATPSSRLSTAHGLPTLAANRGTEPARLTKLVRGELDWIAMKALEKDRDRRYESAAALAADVQRYLADQPVLAGPPSAAYRVRKFVRRNRRGLVTAALLSAMLLALTGGLGWAARDRAAQRGRTAEAVAALLDECVAALRADQRDRAAVALAAAERRAADGGAGSLAPRLDRCRADLELLRALDEIDTYRWTWAGGRYPPGKLLAARWRAALAAHGRSPDDTRPEDAAAWLTESSVRDRVLTALDSCLAADPSPGVRAVLRAADPDPYRDAVRDVLATGDHGAVRPLTGRPEALSQPARFAAVLGQLKVVTADRKRAVLESALRVRPADVGLLMTLGSSYPGNRRTTAAERVRWYQAALAARPGNLAALNNLGTALRDQGKPDVAITYLREAIRIDPAFTFARLNLGNALLDKRDPDAAIAEYEGAIRLDPLYAHAHANLGDALLTKGEPAAAIASLREAVRLDPADPIARFNLGKALRAAGEPEGAIASFKEAIRLDPGNANAYYRLGSILWDVKRDHDGALAAFNEAIRLDPDYADPHTGRGVARLGQGDTDGAIAAFNEAIRLDPNDAPVRNNLAWVLAAGPDRLRDGKRAVELATRACELTGWENPNCLSTLGVAWAEAGDFDKAAEYQRKALAFPEYEKRYRAAAQRRLDLFARKTPYRDPDLAPRKTSPSGKKP